MEGFSSATVGNIRRKGLFALGAASVWAASWTPVRQLGLEFPEEVRFHGTNILDGFAFHAAITFGLWLALSVGRDRNVGNLLPSILAFCIVMACGFNFELSQAAATNAPFDDIDMKSYAIGTGLSAVTTQTLHRKQQ